MKTNFKQQFEKKPQSAPRDEHDTQAALDRVYQLIAVGNLDQALHILRGGVQGDAAKNAYGVCLLRQKRYDEALRAFRSLVLAAGCTWMREDQPVIHRVNLCQALLLDGHPGGCRELLMSMAEQEHPAVQRLHLALNEWVRSLPFWKRVQWRLGLEPDVSVQINFAPGELPATVTTIPSSTIAADASLPQRPASQAV